MNREGLALARNECEPSPAEGTDAKRWSTSDPPAQRKEVVRLLSCVLNCICEYLAEFVWNSSS